MNRRIPFLFPILAAALGAMPVPDAAHGASRTPPRAMAHAPRMTYVNEGILDLEGVDLTRPINIHMNHALGHFVRVLFPKTLDGVESYWRVQGSALSVETARTRDGRKAIDITRALLDYASRTPVVIQARDGKAIVLQVTFTGDRQRDTYAQRTAYLDLRATTDHQFPEATGPAIAPVKPYILLGAAWDKEDVARTIAVLTAGRRHGDLFIGVANRDLQRKTCMGDDVAVPTGSRFLGYAIGKAKPASVDVFINRVVFPDGTQQEAHGYVTVPAKPTAKAHTQAAQ